MTDLEAIREAVPDDLDLDVLFEAGLKQLRGDVWVLPGDWHENLPDSFELEDVTGEPIDFDGLDDERLGVLAFLAPVEIETDESENESD